MSYLNKAKTGAVDSRSNDGDSGSSDSRGVEGIDVDFSETPFVRASPTAFVTGVFPEGEGNPVIRFKNAEYNDDRLDQGYLGLVLDDPEVVTDEDGTEGTVILKTDEQDSTDYRVFNADDSQTKVIDGMGVKFGDRLYEGEFVDALPDTRFILTVSGASAKNVAKRLDKKGALAAGMDEENGGTNGGLMEYKPEELREPGDKYTSRYARDPELKGELYDSRAGVLLARREELDNENTGYIGVEGEPGDTPLLGETDATPHTDPDKASYAELVADDDRYERNMYWYVLFNTDTGEEVEAEVTDEEIEGYTFLHKEWGQFDPSVGGIPDDQWAFVENYVEAAEAGDVEADEDTIKANVEDNAGDFEDAPETSSIVNAIQNRV